VLLILLPYFIYLEWSGGILEHVRGSFEYGNAEVYQVRFDWPVVSVASSGWSAFPWDRDDAVAFLFYCAYALPVIALLLLRRAAYRRNVLIRSAVGAMAVIGILYNAIILRHPLVARVPDLAAVYAILGAWIAVALIRATRSPRPSPLLSWRLLPRASLAAVLAIFVVSIEVLGNVREELDRGRLWDGPAAIMDHAREVVADGREWPWSRYWPSGSRPAAIEYLHACTTPGERMWVSWGAPEYYVFARRGFGEGHANTLSPHSYTTQRDQALMIARLDRHLVPIVLINETTRPDFAAAYPQVEEYLRSHYVAAGEFTIYDSSLISIAMRRGLRATGTYGPQEWPCRLVPAAAAG
jgi:hypothetical protein